MDYAKKLHNINHLKWACRGVVAAATGTSVWANSLTATMGWISIAIMIIAPLIVLGTFELVSRIPLAGGSWLRKFTRPTVTILICLGASYLSYWHQRDAFLRYTSDKNTAYILPGLIDGVMIIAAVSLIELNDIWEQLEARQAGLQVRVEKREPIVATKVRTISGKERVAEVLSRYPDMKIKEIAAQANVSEAYAGNLVSALRKAAREVIEVE